jgi:hypothetical protein
MKKSFSKLALKSLIRKVDRLDALGFGNCKVVLESKASLIWELLFRFQWLKLISDHDDLIDVESRRSLTDIYAEFQNLCNQVPELSDYDLSDGNPTDTLIKSLAINLMDAKESRPEEKCVVVDQLTPLLRVVVNYNFTNEFQDVLPEKFKQAESIMSKVTKDNHWAARGTWNAFVDKSDAPEKKAKKDLSFIKKLKTPKPQNENLTGDDQKPVPNNDSDENLVEA